ncbi:hypothetical protein Goari_022008, partial [Gossypium aridum]|nr:hypothetical protein [Gossypium aridum]
MVDDLANLRVSNEEEDAFQEDAKEMERDIKFSLVGTCFTNSVLHFSSHRNSMADLWHPIGGIAITNIGEKRYSFKFFHTVDMNKVRVRVDPSKIVFSWDTALRPTIKGGL